MGVLSQGLENFQGTYIGRIARSALQYLCFEQSRSALFGASLLKIVLFQMYN